MIQRPMDQNHQPCLLLCLEEDTMGSQLAERLQTLKQQVSDMQPGYDEGLTYACMLNVKPYPFTEK